VSVEVLYENEPEPFKKHDIKHLPTMLVLTPEGKEIGRFGGFYPPDKFVETIRECTASDKNLERAGKLLEEDSGNAEGLYLRALGNLYKKDKQKEAFADMDKLVSKEINEKNRIYICGALWKLAATAHLRYDVKTRQKRKTDYLEKLTKADPKNVSGRVPEALYLLGVSNLRTPDKMREYFDKLRKLDPEDKYGLADDAAFAEALAPYYSREYAKAAGNLEQFIGKNTRSELLPHAYSKLALCYYRAKDTGKTIATLEKLIEKYPKSKEARAAAKWLERLRKQK
jgi:tetratricopeptide (TPR) repeat protein